MEKRQKATRLAKTLQLSRSRNLIIELAVVTWLKDSHALFDYEASENKIERTIIKINKQCKIFRKLTTLQTQIVDQEDMREVPMDWLYVASVRIDDMNGQFKIVSDGLSDNKPNAVLQSYNPEIYQDSYVVVKNFVKDGMQGYQITPGSIVKIGRVEFIVLEINNQTGTDVFQNKDSLQLNKGNYQVEETLSGSCRVCFSEQSSEEDPLISPCQCKGSCELVHLSCLKNWINTKVQIQNKGMVTTIHFQKLICEICKTSFPRTVRLASYEVVELLNFKRAEIPYIIFQSINANQAYKKQRILYMLSGIEDCPVRIGRAGQPQCEFPVNDISVSRLHAEVFYKQNKFYIKDLKSKFGTLVKLRQSISINEGKTLQFGRVCFEFKVKNTQPLASQETQQREDKKF